MSHHNDFLTRHDNMLYIQFLMFRRVILFFANAPCVTYKNQIYQT